MPVLPRAGIVDIRILTFTANHPISLHYILRRFSPTLEPTMLFLLREVDNRCLRSINDVGAQTGGSAKSEQNLRTIVNNIAKDDHVWATAEELKTLKHLKVLSIRTPKAALVSAPTVIYLLRHFDHTFKALIFESVLLSLLLEQRLIKQFVLTLKSSIYNTNNELGLSHDDLTSTNLIQQYLDHLPLPPGQSALPSTTQSNALTHKDDSTKQAATAEGKKDSKELDLIASYVQIDPLTMSSSSANANGAQNQQTEDKAVRPPSIHTANYPPPYSHFYANSTGGLEHTPPIFDSKLALLLLQLLRIPNPTDQSSLYNTLITPQAFPLLVPPDTIPAKQVTMKQAPPPAATTQSTLPDPLNPLPTTTTTTTTGQKKILPKRPVFPGAVYTTSEENEKKRKLIDSLSALDISSGSLYESQLGGSTGRGGNITMTLADPSANLEEAGGAMDLHQSVANFTLTLEDDPQAPVRKEKSTRMQDLSKSATILEVDEETGANENGNDDDDDGFSIEGFVQMKDDAKSPRQRPLTPPLNAAQQSKEWVMLDGQSDDLFKSTSSTRSTDFVVQLPHIMDTNDPSNNVVVNPFTNELNNPLHIVASAAKEDNSYHTVDTLTVLTPVTNNLLEPAHTTTVYRHSASSAGPNSPRTLSATSPITNLSNTSSPPASVNLGNFLDLSDSVSHFPASNLALSQPAFNSLLSEPLPSTDTPLALSTEAMATTFQPLPPMPTLPVLPQIEPVPIIPTRTQVKSILHPPTTLDFVAPSVPYQPDAATTAQPFSPPQVFAQQTSHFNTHNLPNTQHATNYYNFQESQSHQTAPAPPSASHQLKLSSTVSQHPDGTIELLFSYGSKHTQFPALNPNQVQPQSKHTPFLLALHFHSTAPHHYFPNLPFQLPPQTQEKAQHGPANASTDPLPSHQPTLAQQTSSRYGDIPIFKFYPQDNLDPQNPQSLLTAIFPYLQLSHQPTILPLFPLYFTNSFHYAFTKDWYSSYYPQFFYSLSNIPSQRAFNKAFTFSVCDEDPSKIETRPDEFSHIPIYNHPAYGYNRRCHEIMHLAFARPLSLLSPVDLASIDTTELDRFDQQMQAAATTPATSTTKSASYYNSTLSTAIHSTSHISPQFLYEQLQALPPSLFNSALPTLSTCPNCISRFTNHLNRYNSVITSATAMATSGTSSSDVNAVTPQTVHSTHDAIQTLQKTLLTYQIGCCCKPKSTTNTHPLQPQTSQYPIPFAQFNSVQNTKPPGGDFQPGQDRQLALLNDPNTTQIIAQVDNLSYSSYIPATQVQTAIQQCEDLYHIVQSMSELSITAPTATTTTTATTSSSPVQQNYRIGDPSFQSIQGIVPFSTLFALAVMYKKTEDPQRYQQGVTPDAPATQTPAGPAQTPQQGPPNLQLLTATHLSNYASLSVDALEWLLKFLHTPVIYTSTLIEFEPEIIAGFYKKDRDDLYLYPDLYSTIIPTTELSASSSTTASSVPTPSLPKPTASENTSLASSVSKPANQRFRRPARLVDNICSDFYTNNLSHSCSNLTSSGNALMANSGTLLANFSTRLDPVTIANQFTHCRPNESLFQYTRIVSKQPKSLQKGTKPYQMVYLHNLQPYLTPPTTIASPSPANPGFFQVTTLIETNQLHFPYRLTAETLPLFRALLFHLETMPVELRLRLWRHSNLAVPILQQDQFNPDIPLLTRIPLTKSVLEDFLQNEGKQIVVRRKQYELSDSQFLQNDKLREKILKSANAQDLMSKLTNHNIPGGFATGGNSIGTSKVKKGKTGASSTSTGANSEMGDDSLMKSQDQVQLSSSTSTSLLLDDFDGNPTQLSEEARAVGAILNRPGRGRKSLQFHMLHGTEPKWAKGSLALLKQTALLEAQQEGQKAAAAASTEQVGYQQVPVPPTMTTTTTHPQQLYQPLPPVTQQPASYAQQQQLQQQQQQQMMYQQQMQQQQFYPTTGYYNDYQADPYAYTESAPQAINTSNYQYFSDPYNYIPTSLTPQVQSAQTAAHNNYTSQQPVAMPHQPVPSHPFAPSLSSHNRPMGFAGMFNGFNSGAGGLRTLQQRQQTTSTLASNNLHLSNQAAAQQSIDIDSLSEQISSDFPTGFPQNAPLPPPQSLHLSGDLNNNHNPTIPFFDPYAVGNSTGSGAVQPQMMNSASQFPQMFHSGQGVFPASAGVPHQVLHPQTGLVDSNSFYTNLALSGPHNPPDYSHMGIAHSGSLMGHINQPHVGDSTGGGYNANLTGGLGASTDSFPITRPTDVPDIDSLLTDIGQGNAFPGYLNSSLSTSTGFPKPATTSPAPPFLSNPTTTSPAPPFLSNPTSSHLFLSTDPQPALYAAPNKMQAQVQDPFATHPHTDPNLFDSSSFSRQ